MYGSRPIERAEIIRYLVISNTSVKSMDNDVISESIMSRLVKFYDKYSDNRIIKDCKKLKDVKIRLFAPGLFQIMYEL